MRRLSDYCYDPTAGSTMTVIEPERSSLVIYSNKNGGKFRLIFRQKPNPIGFTSNIGRIRK